MPDLIPAPYRLAAGLLALAALFGCGVYAGHHWASVRAASDRTADAEAASARLVQEVRRGDALSARLAAAESHVVIKTVEVIRHVPSVTTGRPCLSGAAVGLLQPGAAAGHEASGEPAAEGAAAPATDTDVAYWIAGANAQYETCAARLNALIDWSEGR